MAAGVEAAQERFEADVNKCAGAALSWLVAAYNGLSKVNMTKTLQNIGYHKPYCAAMSLAPAVRPFALSRPARGRVPCRPLLAASGAGVRRLNRIVRDLCAARGTVWPCGLRPPAGPDVGRSFATRGWGWTSRVRF